MATERQQEALVTALAAQYMANQDIALVDDDVIAFVQEEVKQYDLDSAVVDLAITALPETVQEVM